jgi:hypothetical protein
MHPGDRAGPVSDSSTPVAPGLRRSFWDDCFMITPAKCPAQMTWRISFDDASRSATHGPLCDNGPYVIHRGALAAACVHEAGHAVMLLCTGRRVACVEVAMDFIDLPDGRVAACVRGLAAPITAPATGPDTPDRPIPLWDVGLPWTCWRAQREKALFHVAGAAAETRYRSQAGLSRAPASTWAPTSGLWTGRAGMCGSWPAGTVLHSSALPGVMHAN